MAGSETAFWGASMVRIAGLLIAVSITAAGLSPLAALGTGLGWMSEDDLKSVFAGKEVEGEYPGGDMFRENYGADGNVAYEDDQRTSGGHWSVREGTFCTIYDDDPTGGCFRVRKVGGNCYEFFFVARTEEEAPGPGDKDPDWAARAWLADEEPTCKERLSV